MYIYSRKASNPNMSLHVGNCMVFNVFQGLTLLARSANNLIMHARDACDGAPGGEKRTAARSSWSAAKTLRTCFWLSFLVPSNK